MNPALCGIDLGDTRTRTAMEFRLWIQDRPWRVPATQKLPMGQYWLQKVATARGEGIVLLRQVALALSIMHPSSKFAESAFSELESALSNKRRSRISAHALGCQAIIRNCPRSLFEAVCIPMAIQDTAAAAEGGDGAGGAPA